MNNDLQRRELRDYLRRSNQAERPAQEGVGKALGLAVARLRSRNATSADQPQQITVTL